MNITDVASWVSARIAGISNKIERANSAIRRGPLSLGFAVGTWSLGYDVDSFIALSEREENPDGGDSKPEYQ
jgi:hypothetical protein